MKAVRGLTKNLFFTGIRHVGKTTLLWRAVGHSKVVPGGFVVERCVGPSGERAFRLRDLLTGQEAIVARETPLGWQAVVDGFEGVGVSALTSGLSSARLIIMDELGNFEVGAHMFQKAVHWALDSKVPVLGVIKPDSNPFLNSVRSRCDVEVVAVTVSNRDLLLEDVKGWLARNVQVGLKDN
ncbi:MAG: nucleoside-triphosphatase [Bacillota bacterium]